MKQTMTLALETSFGPNSKRGASASGSIVTMPETGSALFLELRSIRLLLFLELSMVIQVYIVCDFLQQESMNESTGNCFCTGHLIEGKKVSFKQWLSWKVPWNCNRFSVNVKWIMLVFKIIAPTLSGIHFLCGWREGLCIRNKDSHTFQLRASQTGGSQCLKDTEGSN